MKKLLTLLAATIAMTMFACTKDPLEDTVGPIKSIDITDAKYIYSQSKFNPITETSTTKLYKVTTSGITAEVAVLDQNGNLLQIDPVFHMANMNSNLCVIMFQGKTKIYDYIINKSDGTAYRVPQSPNFQFGLSTLVDRNDNIYCFATNNSVSYTQNVSSIFKISQSQAGEIVYQNISAKYNANGLSVDYEGNALIRISNNDGLSCCITPSGKFIETRSLPDNFIFGIDGKEGFYYFNPDGDFMKIYPNESNNDFDSTKIASGAAIRGLDLNIYRIVRTPNNMIVFIKDRMIILDINDLTKIEVRDFPIEVSYGLSTRQTDRYLYLFYANECPPSEDPKIIRFDLNDLSWKYMLEPNKYSIGSYELSTDDVIRFIGVNLITRHKVLVTITPDGQLTEEQYDDQNPITLVSEYIKLR